MWLFNKYLTNLSREQVKFRSFPWHMRGSLSFGDGILWKSICTSLIARFSKSIFYLWWVGQGLVADGARVEFQCEISPCPRHSVLGEVFLTTSALHRCSPLWSLLLVNRRMCRISPALWWRVGGREPAGALALSVQASVRFQDPAIIRSSSSSSSLGV